MTSSRGEARGQACNKKNDNENKTAETPCRARVRNRILDFCHPHSIIFHAQRQLDEFARHTFRSLRQPPKGRHHRENGGISKKDEGRFLRVHEPRPEVAQVAPPYKMPFTPSNWTMFNRPHGPQRQKIKGAPRQRFRETFGL